MIYKNEDGSIYKIEFSISPIPTNGKTSPDAIVSDRIRIKEAIEVLNYLLKKTRHLPEEMVELSPPNDGEPVTKGG